MLSYYYVTLEVKVRAATADEARRLTESELNFLVSSSKWLESFVVGDAEPSGKPGRQS